MRGMTAQMRNREIKSEISIHIPHARDDQITQEFCEMVDISIHIPHARDDHVVERIVLEDKNFNPHPSCEG